MNDLEDLCPKLQPCELFFYNRKIILKSSLKQVTLPVQALCFLIYFNGQYSLKEIIQRSYAVQKTFHFGLFLKTIYLLEEKKLLKNNRSLSNLLPQSHLSFNWLTFSRSLYNIKISPLSWSFYSSPLFIGLSLALIGLSIWAAIQLPIYEVLTNFIPIQGNYEKGFISLLFCLSLGLNFKYILQIILQLSLLGRVNNVTATFNGLCLYLHTSSSPLFLSPRRNYTLLYLLCGIGAPLLFSLTVQHLPFQHWILNHAHLAALIVFISNLNPTNDSDTSQIFRLLHDDENLNKISQLFQELSLSIQYNKKTRWTQFLYHFYEFSSIAWVLIVLTSSYYYVYESSIPTHQLHPHKSTSDLIMIWTFFIIFFLFFVACTIYLLRTLYNYLSPPLVLLYFSSKKKLFYQFNEKYDKEKLSKELQTLSLFSLFDSLSLQKIIDRGEVLQYKKNHSIIHQGERGDELFVLLKGHLDVVNTISQPTQVLGHIKPIAIFGESAFTKNKRRMAEIIATSDSTIFQVSADLVRNILPKNSGAEEIQNLNNSIALDQFFSSSIFENISPKATSFLKKKGFLDQYSPGETIYRERQIGDHLYFIIRGSVGIYRGSQLINQIRQDSFFGEISILSNVSRFVTIKALNNVLTFNINREDLWDVLSENLDLSILIESIGKIRVKQINEALPKEAVEPFT